MNDGEVELSEHLDSSRPSISIDSFVDDFLKTATTCTHTHTCNPPGPDSTHTHTCFHTHTQVIPSKDDYAHLEEQRPSSEKRVRLGNREAVRKYREKKKAQTVYLEEEVKKLRLVNQQLVRKLQGQAILEAEALRLRVLLQNLRGKIDNELGAFPSQNQWNQCDPTSGEMNIGCGTNTPCLDPNSSTPGQVPFWRQNCQTPITDCRAANMNDATGTEGCEKLVSSDSELDEGRF